MLLYFSLSDLIISYRTHWKSWRWLLTWWRSLHLFLPQKHTIQLSAEQKSRWFPALHSRNTSDGIKTPLQLMRKLCFLKQIRTWAITITRSPNSQTYSMILDKLTVTGSNPSCFVILLFLYYICHFTFILSMQIYTVGSKSENSERCSYYGLWISLQIVSDSTIWVKVEGVHMIGVGLCISYLTSGLTDYS